MPYNATVPYNANQPKHPAPKINFFHNVKIDLVNPTTIYINFGKGKQSSKGCLLFCVIIAFSLAGAKNIAINLTIASLLLV